MTQFSKRLPDYHFELAKNRLHRHAPYGPDQEAILDEKGFQRAAKVIRSWPDYAPTTLCRLGSIAEVVGVADVHYKDESARFGLGSFKPLGGAYAVIRLLMSQITVATGQEQVDPNAVLNGRYQDIASTITVTAATDGNHGRSEAIS